MMSVSWPSLSRRCLNAIALLAFGFCIPATAHAQYYDGPAYAFPVTDMIGPAMAGSSMNSYIRKSKKTGPSGQGSGPQADAASKEGPSVSLQVPASSAISQKVKSDFHSQLVRSNPDKRSAIDQALSRDWLAGYRAEIATPNGLDSRNLADAVTAYMVAAWAIVHKQEQISPRAIAAVRGHFRTSMAASSQLARLSPDARQEMAENLIYQTVLIMANRTQIARTKDGRLADAASRHYRAAVRTGTHVDLQTVRLEDRGFATE